MAISLNTKFWGRNNYLVYIDLHNGLQHDPNQLQAKF